MVREYSTLKINWECDRTRNTISYRIVSYRTRIVSRREKNKRKIWDKFYASLPSTSVAYKSILAFKPSKILCFKS